MTTPHFTVTRWHRYGHDRLYIDRDGTRLGYWDLNSNTAHPDNAADLAVIEQVAADWLATAPSPPSPDTGQHLNPAPANPGIPVSDAPRAHPSVVEPGWDDLSNTKAGAAARAQAQALRDAAPVRTFLARALRVKTDERAWRIGADGEEVVAAQLKKLGDGWRVLHAVPVGDRGSDIDHVIIGPPGVFTLNAKNHPDARIWVRGNTFKVNGQNVPYVRNSRHEAQRAARLLTAASGLPVEARGVVVIYGATGGLTIKEQPDDVRVIARRQVVGWLRKQPVLLTAEQVAHIYEHARRSTTWQPGPNG